MEELKTRFDSANSFYRKAMLEEDEKEIRLISYSTHVATWNKETKTMKVHGLYSDTTTRHIKEFIYQMFDDGMRYSTKEIQKKFM